LKAMATDSSHKAIDLSIVIVSWNVLDLLRACLQSIYASHGGMDLEVIVVDAGSEDGSPEMVRADFPEARLIARRDNVGFPKGNNLGLSEARGRHMLLLNPDTEVIGDALAMLVHFMDEHADVGAAGGQLLNPDGSVQSSRRRFPTVATGAFESTWLQPIAPRRLLADYYAEDISDVETADVDWLVGACLIVRREVVEQVGYLDEAYFMYSEELDWCRRIKEAGWRVVYMPKARFVHHIGKSSEQAITERHINFQRAKLRYYRKFHGRTAAAFLRAILLLNYAAQLVVETAKGLLGHRRDLRRQRTSAYWRVLRSGLPPAGY
jgi:N-acetylglucosaminyl-diphospho-decaprenol L-rhamnosyltransferase